MTGWKTWMGAALIGIGAALKFLGYVEIGAALEGFGVALAAVGVAHKIEKAGVASAESK